MPTQPFQTFTTGEQAPLNASLLFQAQSVTVTNLSASWCYFPDASYPVPPWTYGAVLRLQGTSQARVNWTTPTGLAPATPAGGTVTTVWDAEPLAPSNGQTVVVPGAQTVPLTVASVVTPPVGFAPATVGSSKLPLKPGSGSSASSYTMNLPAATESVMVVLSQEGISSTTQTVTVTGVQSGAAYATLTLTSPAAPAFFEVVTGADTTLAVTIGAGGSAANPGDYIQLVAMPFPGALTVVQAQPTTNPLTVDVIQTGGVALPVVATGAEPTQPSLPTEPGPGYNIQAVQIAATVAAGAALTIVPADFSLRTVYLGRLHLGSTSAVGTSPFVLIQGSGNLAQFDLPVAATIDTTFDYAPVATGGTSVILTNEDSVSRTFRGFVTWQWW